MNWTSELVERVVGAYQRWRDTGGGERSAQWSDLQNALRALEAYQVTEGRERCNCESLALAETEEIALRASLGRAVEALQAIKDARKECEQCDYDCRDDCEHTAFWRQQAKADELTPAVLSDLAGQRAGREWSARGEVCEAAEEYMRYGGPGGQDMERTAGRREAKVRLREALRRLKEVQQDA